jgi:hypothetical protein
MKFRSGRKPVVVPPPATFREGDLVVSPDDKRYIIDQTKLDYDNDADNILILRPEGLPALSAGVDTRRWLPLVELRTDQWTHLPREEVKRMARTTNAPTPPKLTRADWLKRDKAKVTLTRGELDQLARLVTAGRALLRNEPSISPTLRTAMTKLGMDTKGL